MPFSHVLEKFEIEVKSQNYFGGGESPYVDILMLSRDEIKNSADFIFVFKFVRFLGFAEDIREM